MLRIDFFSSSQNKSSHNITIEESGDKVALETKLSNGTEDVDVYLVPQSAVKSGYFNETEGNDPPPVIVAVTKESIAKDGQYIWTKTATVSPTPLK